MSSNTALRRASMLGTLLLAALFSGLVIASPKPAQPPLHPAVKPLPSDAAVQSQSYVS